MPGFFDFLTGASAPPPQVSSPTAATPSSTLSEPATFSQSKPQSQLLSLPTSSPASPSVPSQPHHLPCDNTLTSARSLHQLSLFIAGSTFTTLSLLITSRALRRKRLSLTPRYFTSSPSAGGALPEINGAVEAAEALVLATLNVAAIGSAAFWGACWAGDVSGFMEVRARLRGLMGVGPGGMGGPVGEGGMSEADREIEEWMVGVLAKKEVREMALEMARGPPGAGFGAGAEVGTGADSRRAGKIHEEAGITSGTAPVAATTSHTTINASGELLGYDGSRLAQAQAHAQGQARARSPKSDGVIQELERKQDDTGHAWWQVWR